MIERLRFADHPVWIPPHNAEAEEALLGSALLDRDVVARVQRIVAPRDFYRDRNATIFTAMRDLLDRGEPVDYLTLTDELVRTAKLDEAGGRGYVGGLIGAVPTPLHAERYAAIVAEAGVMRRLISAGGKIMAIGAEYQHDAETAIAKSEAIMLEVAASRPTDGARPVGDLLRDYLDQVQAIRDGAAVEHAIPTGWYDLDRVLRGGLKRSDLIVLAARPGMGKSAMCLGVAAHAGIRLGIGVMLFSLEMSARQVTARLLATESGIESERIERADLSIGEQHRLGAALGPLAEAKIVIDDASSLSPSELRSRVRRAQAEHPIDLVIVDYLGLMTTGREGSNRVQEVAEITRQLKALARDQGVAVLVLSQLNRSVEQRNPKVPLLSDLRDSGAVEQDADVVLFIYRDDYYNRDSERQGQADLIIAKHRSGPTGQVTLLFHQKTTRFLDLEVRQEAVPWYSA